MDDLTKDQPVKGEMETGIRTLGSGEEEQKGMLVPERGTPRYAELRGVWEVPFTPNLRKEVR